MDDRSPWWKAGASFTVALSFYVGSYILVCKPVATGILLPPHHISAGGPYIAEELHVPAYRFGGRISETLYRPLVQLDMKLFPGRWLVPVPSEKYMTPGPSESR